MKALGLTMEASSDRNSRVSGNLERCLLPRRMRVFAILEAEIPSTISSEQNIYFHRSYSNRKRPRRLLEPKGLSSWYSWNKKGNAPAYLPTDSSFLPDT